MPSDDQFVENTGPSAYVGLIPAAGVGARLPGRELSKEMLPVDTARETGSPVISHLLGRMARAGIREVTVVLRPEKQDIRDYLAGDEWDRMTFDFRTTPGTSGVPETVALGLKENENSNIAFGFPDILFEPANAFGRMMDRLNSGNADVVLGLFPTPNPTKMDMVDTNKDGTVIEIEIKPGQTRLAYTWILAVWKPTFTAYLCNLVNNDSARVVALATTANDNHLGQVFRLAIADGLAIDSLAFSSGRSLDIGTPDDLALAQSWAE
jgi:glucose-1-phosphate thymidylyltransferase